LLKVETVSGDRRLAKTRSRLDRLFRLHVPWVTHRIERRFGSDAEDVVQEAWLWIIPMSAQETIRHPKALLLKVASNIAISRARQSRRRSELLAAYVPEVPNAYWADQAETVLLRQVILGLPQPLRDVFVLSRVGGLTNSQIAEQLGISPKTVEWRMTKALAYCAAQLRR
jgi:RNA polymerase sigma factor (sigma-70 family)